MISTEWQRNILTHVFFVALFLVVPVLAFVRPPGEPFFTFTPVVVQDTLANFVLLCFFYLNYYLLIPSFFFHKKYFAYVVSILVFLSLAFLLPYWAGKQVAHVGPGFPMPPSPPGALPPFALPERPSVASFVFDEFRRHLFLFFTAVFFAFLLRTRERLSVLKEEKLDAELSSLKAQINPHFLFNAFNSIYALVLRKDQRAPDAILHIAGLMRYTLKEAQDYKIPLEKEFEYIRNYIELERARFGDTADLRIQILGDTAGKEIAPLVLITYVENAFKYGINPEASKCVIDILLQATGNGVVLKVSNAKYNGMHTIESTGVGMKNTAQRLEHLYAGKYQLHVSDQGELFAVTLQIELL